MIRLTEAVVFTMVLLAACIGAGGSVLRWAQLEEPGELGADRAISVGLSGALGLALLVALGGLGTMLRVPVALSIAAFMLAGVALLIVHLVRVELRWARVWLLVLLIEVVALGLVLLTQAGVGLAFPLNPCDDAFAYLPQARRLLITRTLLEPWSTRRLQNFGGQTFLQATYIRFLGKDALGLTETLLPTALLWLLVTTVLRRPIARLVSLAPLVFLPFFDVPRFNTAGTLSPVPLFVALGVLVLLLRLASRRKNERGQVVAAGAIGVTVAAIVAIRTNVAPAAALIAVVGVATLWGTWRDRARAMAVCVLSGIVAFAPWAIAMWESSGTPLYPLLRGNANPRVPALENTNLEGVGDLVENAWHLVRNGTYPAALLVLLVLVIAARRVLPMSATTAVLMATAALVNVVILTVSVSLAPAWDFARYTFPLGAAVLFFALRSALVRLDEEPSITRRTAVPPAFLAVAMVIAFFWIGTSQPRSILSVSGVDTARTYVERAADIRDPDDYVTPGASVARARSALAAVPRGARAILAVADPDAFLTAGADLQSMDQPGFVAPGGRFPFFSGPEAKVRILRDNGYDFLIVTPTRGHPCYEHGRLEDLAHSDVPAYRLQAPYVLDFFDDMDELAQRFPEAARTVNGLYVIDLRAIPGTTPRDPAVRRARN